MNRSYPPRRAVTGPGATADTRPGAGILGLSRDEDPAAEALEQEAAGGRLIVGEGIQVKGEIQSCRTLIVEGKVEASLDAQELSVARGGIFAGKAKVATASIDGRFDGELTVDGLLTLRAGGRVTGKLRYRDLKIEQGGRLSGDIDLLEDTAAEVAEKPRRPAAAAADQLLESAAAR